MSTLLLNTDYCEKNKHLHNKIAELASLADSLSDDRHASQVSMHIPVYADKEFFLFVKQRYEDTKIQIRNTTFHLLSFTTQNRNESQSTEIETETFGKVCVKYSVDYRQAVYGGEELERIVNYVLVEKILSVEHGNGQELLPFLTAEYIKELEYTINIELQ